MLQLQMVKPQVLATTATKGNDQVPIPPFMMNPYTGRTIRTDNNKARKVLNLPLLPRKPRKDKGKKRKDAGVEGSQADMGVEEGTTGADPEEHPEVPLSEEEDVGSEGMEEITDLVREAAKPVEEDPVSRDEGMDSSYISREALRSSLVTGEVQHLQRPGLDGVYFPAEYCEAYRQYAREQRRYRQKA